MDKQLNQNFLKYIGLGSFLAFSIAGPLLAGMYLGHYLDQKMATGTVLTFTFSVLGLFTGLRMLYKIILDIGKKERKKAGRGDKK
ncbi:MAG: AtpZ/AtpI family protein [bacterium]|jgi:ATP synthase protein I